MTIWTRLRALPVTGMLLVLAAAGCDRVEPTAAPAAPPRFSSLTDATGYVYVIAEGKYATRTVSESAIIGAAGGKLGVAGHQISVPAGAVDRPTRFTITMSQEKSPSGNQLVKVDNTAYQQDAGGAWTVNVGAAGFLKPLTLRMSYGWATNVSDPGRLLILWDREDGTAEPYATSIDTSTKMVTAQLTHFSIYAVGSSARSEEWY
ncbi:MAG TPA: hypothetical protein VHG51_14740 [Longimicrobiaceae bacterium]|nr:hypothetical protein [Longimicrobiaceae bacterium]